MESESEKFGHSRWLRHVYPDRVARDPYDVLRDNVSLKLEEQIAWLTDQMRRGGLAGDGLVNLAANLLVEQALALQRQHSPDGYEAMVTNIFLGDPSCPKGRAWVLEYSNLMNKKSQLKGFLLGAGLTFMALGLTILVM